MKVEESITTREYKMEVRRELEKFGLGDVLIEEIVEGRGDGKNTIRILNAIYNHSYGAKVKDIKRYLEKFDTSARYEAPHSVREKLKMMRRLGLVDYGNKRYRLTDKGRRVVEVTRPLYSFIISELEEVYGWVRNTE